MDEISDYAEVTRAEIACAIRWDRCVAAAVHIDVHGDDDPHRIAWAADILRWERMHLAQEARARREATCSE